MLSLPTLPVLFTLLAHTFTAAQHLLLPTAGGPATKTPAKRIEGLLGLAARQFFCDPGYGICDNGMQNCGLCPKLTHAIIFNVRLLPQQWFMLLKDRRLLPIHTKYSGVLYL
jgi:hypothetical protein